MTTAPILVTDRLTLLGHAASDLEDCAAMWADPRVYMMIGGQPRSREDVWIRLLRSIGQWTLFGYGSWIARETATGRLIGELGLIEARRAIVPAIDATPEVGWTLAGGPHGQGFGSEALAAIFTWTAPRVRRTVCIIDPPMPPLSASLRGLLTSSARPATITASPSSSSTARPKPLRHRERRSIRPSAYRPSWTRRDR